jgi:LysM repeat protein
MPNLLLKSGGYFFGVKSQLRQGYSYLTRQLTSQAKERGNIMISRKKLIAASTTAVLLVTSLTIYGIDASRKKNDEKRIAEAYSALTNEVHYSIIEEQRIDALNNGLKQEAAEDAKRVKTSKGAYIIVEGDTLWDIAKDFGTSPEELKKINNLSNDNLKIGETLVFTKPVENKAITAKASRDKATVIKVASRGSNLSQRTVSSTKPAKAATASRGSSSSGKSVALDWWSEASKVFSIGSVAKVIDVHTGKSFNVKRTFGSNHADCEALTSKDSSIIKSIWGGWTWNRRPVIVVVGNKRIAASMSSMPHAGLDKYPALQTVDGRSEGYGTGTNLDAVKGNGMDGHFDIHFLNSTRHKDGKVDNEHQKNIRQAVGR